MRGETVAANSESSSPNLVVSKLSILSRVDSPSACGVSGIKKLAVHTPSACGGVIDSKLLRPDFALATLYPLTILLTLPVDIVLGLD
jgi:hypothetical protein